ncbi:unnamed protein product [Rotaria socialis]|uniref:ADP ribosyltransferase domain-containing protein n=1 Tax=Rotaria socialis TaxID=392032 RepID=A0A820YF52_9BILA|nr:unnamed protein product [Rotaria socialis]CAF4511069.1 unnamed protein product [Rotaria socialis]CAF4549124.1 unnamed protein product [Rotaria socialis]
MSRSESGISSRYITTTLPVTWPKSRSETYRRITQSDVHTESINIDTVFRKWTIEGPDSCYKQINRALLHDDHHSLSIHANYINELRAAIKQNLSWEPIKVYRGLKFNSFSEDKIHVGMTFLWPTFSSTSRDRRVAKMFGSYLFEIEASSNDGTYRADISNYSQYQGEKEILFYPYSGFRVC